MNTAERHDDVNEETSESVLRAAPDLVEVRRNGGLSALIGVVASGVAIAYLSRAASTGALLDWVLVAVMGLIGAGYLRAFVDARTPLLVADAQGLRVRLGHAWRGLPWGALESIEHTPRRGLLRDGKLVLNPHNPDRVLAELDGPGRRQARVNLKLHGAAFAVPLGLSTRVGKGNEDLTTSLRQLAGGTTRVIEPAPPVEAPADTEAAPEADTAADTGTYDDRESLPLPVDLAPRREPRKWTRERTPKQTPEPLHEPVQEPDDFGHMSPEEPEAPESLEAPESAEDPDLEATVSRRDPRLVIASVIAALSSRRKDPEASPEADADDPVEEVDAGAEADTEEHTDPEPTAPQLTLNPIIASATPSPLRETRSGSRAEVRSQIATEGAAALARAHDENDRATDLPEGRELRRQGSVNLVEENTVWGDRVRPIATAKANVEPLVIDEFAVEPAVDPVIGPDITAARTRIGLSVDSLAERTRIRPHVIESIEVDDFVPCGGDFYARGHLRTLARVLGLDDTVLLKAYDERYADAPINPRRVFEAELATGSSGGIRSTKGGPNWSVLIAAIMTLVLAWSVARLVMDQPPELQDPVPMLNGSGGLNQGGGGAASSNVTVKVSATNETHLVVIDDKGKVVFEDDVEYGEVHRLDVSPPVTVKASDAGAVDVEIDGESKGAVGADGREAEKTFQND